MTVQTRVDTEALRVSIAILCYDQADGIRAVIESARAQTRPADEVFVVDDGSSDASRQVIARFRDVRLVAHAENRGRAAARTTALRAASGDIIVYLDGDTEGAPDLVEQLLREYADPDVAAVGGVVHERVVDSVWDRWRARHGTRHRGADRNPDADLLFGWALSCRREEALAIGGFRPASEDIDLSFRLRARGHRLVQTSRARVYHRRSDSFWTLRAMLVRWASGGYAAFARAGDARLHPHVTRLFGRVMWQLRRDVFVERDWLLALATLALVPWEVVGLLDGWRYMRSGGRRTSVRGL